MESRFRNSFDKDISKIRDQNILALIYEAIINVETANSVLEIKGLKKLRGSRLAYRIKIKDYRVGLYIENEVADFTRCLHRKDIYKYFP